MEAVTSDPDKVQSIDPEEARLLEEYEQLTAKLHKQSLILSVMKDINCDDIKNVDESGKKNIDKALDFVRAYDYLKMDASGTNVLGNFLLNLFDSTSSRNTSCSIICRYTR